MSVNLHMYWGEKRFFVPFLLISRAKSATLRRWRPGTTTHSCVASGLSGRRVPGVRTTFVLAAFTPASKGRRGAPKEPY